MQGPCFGLLSFHQLSVSLSQLTVMCLDRRLENKEMCFAGDFAMSHLIPPVYNLLVVCV